MPVREEFCENNIMEETEVDGSDDEILTVKRGRQSRIESDSETETHDIVNHDKPIKENSGTTKSRTRVIIGDSSDEDDNSKLVPLSDVLASGVNSTESPELETSKSCNTNEQNASTHDFKQIFANKDLYDAEDSDDDIQTSKNVIGKSDFENYDADDEEKQQVMEKKPRSRKQEVPKKSNMPFAKGQRTKKKEPKDEVDKIHSETQRLIRKSRVSLPYHKPRQRTLAEFLQRRPSIPTKSLRMSTDELKKLAKEVNKRAKEVEEFYKSSSEEEKDGGIENLNKEDKKEATFPDPRDSEISDKKDCDISIKKSSLECHKTTEVLNADLEENGILNKDAVNDLVKNTETRSDVLCSIGCDAKLNSELSKEAIDVDPKRDSQCIALSTDSVNQNLQEQDLRRQGFPFSEDTQSAMDVEKPSVMNSFIRNPFDESSELGSQDVHLQFDNTETSIQVNAQNVDGELCLSKTIRNIIKPKDTGNLSLILNEDTANETDKEQIRFCGEIDSQPLQIELTNSIGLNSLSPKKTEIFLNFNHFAKPEPGICAPKSHPNLVGIDRIGSNSCSVDEELGSQDICLKLENSETLDALNDEKSEICDGKLLDGDVKSILNFKEPSEVISKSEKDNILEVCASESSHKLTGNSLQNSSSELLFNNKPESHTESDDSKSKLPARRSLIDLFSDTRSISKDTNLEISVSSSQFQGKSSKTTEDPILILEGDETRVSFEQENSLLDNKAANSADKLSSGNEYKSHLNQLGKELKAVTPLEEILKTTLQSLKGKKEIPCLKATPGEVIDLDATPNPSNVNLLKQRFLRHSLPKVPVKCKTIAPVSVITAEQGANGEVEVKKEFLTLDSEKDCLVGNRSKLLDLKKELQKQIVKEREQEWCKRQLEMKEVSNFLEPDEKSECGLFDEEEEILETETESEDDEDEEIEDYAEKKNKKFKMKSAFVEDEAEVSGESEEEEEDDDADDDNGDDGDNDDNEHNNDDEDDNNDEDGDDGCNDVLSGDVITNTLKNSSVCKSASNECTDKIRNNCIDNDSKSEETKDCLSLNETTSSLKRMKTLDPFASQESSKVVQSLPEDSDDIEISQTQDEELDVSLGIPPYQPGGAVTQISDAGSQDLPATLPQKEKLVDEGRFNSFPNHSDTLNALGIPISLNEGYADEAELLGLCSGKFSSQPAVLSQDENLFSNDHISSLSSNSILSKKKMILEDDSDDSQSSSLLLKIKSNDHFEGSPIRRKLAVLSDDDDEEAEAAKVKNQKKLQKKIQYSDDEEEENEIVKALILSDDESLGDPQEVEYDSEENEIPVSKHVAKDFFENEAELSESEWGSADEDEKGLDDFEIEEGDDEKFDQNSVKEQLDKIHMRQLLDEDQRDIKRLQEMLLEDGEFHSEGAGRQRQFRWKNLNDIDINLGKRSDDENGDGEEEEEDESEWRRLRFEREKFLQEHKDSLEKEELISAAAIKLKMKFDVLAPKKTGQVKRGSFLARSEAALARIAQIAKSSETPVLQPKNSRNFVFATLSQEPKEREQGASKRKAAAPQESPLARKKSKPNTSTPSLLEKIG